MKHEFDEFKDSYGDEIDSAIGFSGKDHDFFTKVKAGYLNEIITGDRAPGDEGQSQPLRILDIGCGHGLIHPHLMQAISIQIELHGIDPAKEVIEKAEQSNPGVSYKVYDGEILPYETATFDVAYTICVMHHVPPNKWMAFLSEMVRVVKPGGKIIIIEHNPFNPLTQWIVKTCPIDKDAVLLRSGLTKKILTKAGASDVACRHFQFTPFDGAFFAGFDRFMGWLPLGAQYFVVGQRN